MNVEDLRKKVESAEQKVEKCKNTIERHQATMEKKALQLRRKGVEPELVDFEMKCKYARSDSEKDREIYWLLSDYEDKKNDIEGAQKKLGDAERILAGWKEKLDIAINEEMVLTESVPQVIKDFLEAWKENAFGWYCQRYEEFLNFRIDLRLDVRGARLEALRTLPELEQQREIAQRCFGDEEPDDSFLANLWPRKPVEAYLKEKELDRDSVEKKLRQFGDGIIFKMLDFRDKEKREAFLDKTLEDEKKAKMLKLVGRISEITGTITDARGLYISGGDLNGVVLGEKGAANVQTIGAGGYNIQCFHYRMLVHDVSDRYKNSPGLDDVIAAAQLKASVEGASNSSRKDFSQDKG